MKTHNSFRIKNLIPLFSIFFWCQVINKDFKTFFIIWNVGQGSFTTFVQEHSCIHIDAGGQHFPLKRVTKICLHKKNKIAFTHFDKDHINFIDKLKNIFHSICDLTPNTRLVDKKYQIKQCKLNNQTFLTAIYKSKFTHRNESHVYLLKNRILITGDNPKQLERRITKDLRKKNQHQIFTGRSPWK